MPGAWSFVGHKSHCLKSRNEPTILKQESLFRNGNHLKMFHTWFKGCWVMPWVLLGCVLINVQSWVSTEFFISCIIITEAIRRLIQQETRAVRKSLQVLQNLTLAKLIWKRMHVHWVKSIIHTVQKVHKSSDRQYMEWSNQLLITNR